MTQISQKSSVAVHQIELPTGFAVGPVNSFVLINGDERILVDCGPKLPETQAALSAGLQRLGLSIPDLTGLVLTHGHVDHVGLSALIQSQGIPIYALPDVASWLDPGSVGDLYRLDFYRHYYPRMGMPKEDMDGALAEFFSYRNLNDRSVVDVPLKAGDVFAPLPMFRILAVPGHAQAAIALWNEEAGQLIIGDQVLPHISSNALVEPMPGAPNGGLAGRTKSLLQYRANLVELNQLPVRRTFPGHGAPFDNLHEIVTQRLAEQEKRRDKVEKLLSEHGPISAYALATIYFPKHRNQASLILSEILGYLDWLAELGRAHEVVDDEGNFIWHHN